MNAHKEEQVVTPKDLKEHKRIHGHMQTNVQGSKHLKLIVAKEDKYQTHFLSFDSTP